MPTLAPRRLTPRFTPRLGCRLGCRLGLLVELEEACRRVEQARHAQALDGRKVVAAQPPPRVAQLGRLMVDAQVVRGCKAM